MVILFLTFWGTDELFHSNWTILHSHQQWMRVPISPHLCQHLLFFCLFYFCNCSHPPGCEVCLIVVLIYISLMTNDVEHLFMCLLVIYISLEKYQALCPFLNLVVCLSVVEFQEFFICSGYKSLIWYMFFQIFSPIVYIVFSLSW